MSMTRRKQILATLAFACCSSVSGQWPTRLWYNFPQDGTLFSNGASPLPGGDVFFGLQFDPTSGMGLMRTDVNGTPLWARKWSVANPFMLVTYNQGALADGDLFAFGAVMNQPMTRPYLMRTTASGNLIWCKQYDLGPDVYDYERLTAYPAPDGTIIIIATRGAYFDLLKVGGNGAVIWSQRVSKTLGQYISAEDLIFTNDSDMVIAGWTPLTSGTLMRFHPDGSLVWGYRYQAASALFFKTLAIDDVGDLVVGGSIDNEHFAMKVNDAGDVQWANSYAGFGVNAGGEFTDVIVDDQGNSVYASLIAWMNPADRTFLCDPNGQLLAAGRTAYGTQYGFDVCTNVSFGNSLSLSCGSMSGTPGSNDWNQIFFWRLPPDDYTGCAQSTLAITVSPWTPGRLSFGILAPDTVVVTDLPMTDEGEVTVNMNAFCGTLGVEEDANLPQLSVTPTLVAQGGVISISGVLPGSTLDLVGMNGAILPINVEDGRFHSDGFPAGAYVIAERDPRTGNMRTVRFVKE